MNYAKGMDSAQGAENERRGWDKERYERKFDWNGNECHYDWFRRKLNFEIVIGKIMPMTSQNIPVHERLQNRLACFVLCCLIAWLLGLSCAIRP